MFRLASTVLLAASLTSVAFAQADDTVVKSPQKQAPGANGSVSEPIENGSAPADNGSEPGANGSVDADAAAAAAQPKPIPFAGSAYLELSVKDFGLRAFVHGAEPGFMGLVGLSLTPDLAHSFTGLPPLLVDAVVVAYGFTKTQDLELMVPKFPMAAEAILVYGQAVILDEHGIWASGIVPLAIGEPANGTEPANGGAPSNANLAQPAAH